MTILDERQVIGLVLHPVKDTSSVVGIIERWAALGGLRVQALSALGVAPQAERGWTLASDHAPDCAMVIAVGGDGTVLRALSVAAPVGAPVLGVNLGRLGFLAEVAVEQLPTALELIETEHARIERRPALAVAIQGDAQEPVSLGVAYNDAAVSRIPGHGQAAIALHLADAVFARYYADGLVLATASGSTAYNFALGGPLITPTLDVVAATPIAAHGLFSTSVVAESGDGIKVEALLSSAPLAVEVDGRTTGRLEPGELLVAAPSDHPALLVRVSPSTFYERARSRLGLADPAALETAPRRDHTNLQAIVQARPASE